ncbi:MAG TPA: Ig-like domain-containing protein [Nitrososphaera sp.]|nr:Ig-like domain-containing protein [Nitrososphaera sp.]
MKRLDSTLILSILLLFTVFMLPANPVLLKAVAAAEEDGEEEEDAAMEDDYEYYEDGYGYEEPAENDDPYYYDDYQDDGASSGAVEAAPFDDSVTISEHDIVTLNVLANDKALIGAGASPKLVETTDPEFGEIIINSDNTITYSPSQIQLPSGYEKADVVHYTATTDGVSLYTGTITFWIQQVNDSPIAYSANYTIKENQQAVLYLDAYDEDNDGLTFTAMSEPAFGEFDLDPHSGRLAYTPLYEFAGKVEMTFQVSDGTSASEVATIELTVLEVGAASSQALQVQEEDDVEDDEEEEGAGQTEDPATEGNSATENTMPVADAGDDFDALAGDIISLDASGSHDSDNDSLTFSWLQTGGPEVSLVSADTDSPSFDAPLVESETHLAFELTVSDGNLTDTASVTINVIPVTIDIMPNVYPNNIYLSQPDVEVPVAVTGSSVLDATAVNLVSLGLGPNSAPAVRYELSDFNADGFTDHISYYRTGDLGLQLGDKTACLTGSVDTANGNSSVEFSVCRNVKVKE